MCPLLGNPGARGLRRYPAVVDRPGIDRSAAKDLRVPGLILLTIRFHLGRYIGESLLTLLFNQEPITQSGQLPCTRVTTLLPASLFLERFVANFKISSYSQTSTNDHLSTTATFLVDIPYIDSCLNLPTTVSSPQGPLSSWRAQSMKFKTR